GDYVVLTEEDFKKANVRKTKTIDIIDFTDEKQIDSIYYEKPYYLEPDKGAAKAYGLLMEALNKAKKVGVAQFVIRNKEHLGVIKPYKNLIVLNQLRYKSEIKPIDELQIPKPESVRKGEIEMALKLINQLTAPFKPDQFKDTYVEELKDVIKQKARGRKPKAKGREPKATEVSDIMTMLKASLEEKERVR
ncbi:MAG: Ku protein, partial [Candidatus Doudnabacteria bacterium]|nr:Ku protein [Candidatus Doudnabacteria bacterium]